MKNPGCWSIAGLVGGADMRGLRLLIVDDEESMRGPLVQHLRSCGFAPSAVSSTEEAVAALRQAPAESPYELLLIDWKMPGTDSLETVKAALGDEPQEDTLWVF